MYGTGIQCKGQDLSQHGYGPVAIFEFRIQRFDKRTNLKPHNSMWLRPLHCCNAIPKDGKELHLIKSGKGESIFKKKLTSHKTLFVNEFCVFSLFKNPLNK